MTNPYRRGDHYLAGHGWYAQHQAWLRGQGLPHHAVSDFWDDMAQRLTLTWNDTASAFVVAALMMRSSQGAILDGAKGLPTQEEEERTWVRVVQAVIDHPELLYMGEWHSQADTVDGLFYTVETAEALQGPACGTAHCIAGWAQALARSKTIRQMEPADAGVRLLPRHAWMFHLSQHEAEGIIQEEAQRLGLTPRPHKHRKKDLHL